MTPPSTVDRLDGMLAEISSSLSAEEVSSAQRTAQDVASQDVVMTVRMFAAAPEED